MQQKNSGVSAGVYTSENGAVQSYTPRTVTLVISVQKTKIGLLPKTFPEILHGGLVLLSVSVAM